MFWFCRPRAAVKLTQEDCLSNREDLCGSCRTISFKITDSQRHRLTFQTEQLSEATGILMLRTFDCVLQSHRVCVNALPPAIIIPTRVECARFTSSLETTQTNSNVSMSLRVRRADGDKGGGHRGPRSRQMGALEKAKAG